MKEISNIVLISMITSFLFLVTISCEEDSHDIENGNNTIENELGVDSIIFENPIYSDDGHSVTLKAYANNAQSYIWDLGNGTTDGGDSVIATYLFDGNYWVICTAIGKVNQITDSIKVQIIHIDPPLINEVVKLLTDHSWGWAGNGTLPNDYGMWSAGPKGFVYTADSAKLDYTNAFDDSFWKLGEFGKVIDHGQLDDVYTFNLNKEMLYTNSYGETGFMWNWGWAYHLGLTTTENFKDSLFLESEKTGFWELTIIDHYSDTLPKTIVNGNEIAKSYIISISGGAYLGVRGAAPEYQICRIDADTMWVRYDNTYPQDLNYDPLWDDNSIFNTQWGYFYLVKK